MWNVLKIPHFFLWDGDSRGSSLEFVICIYNKKNIELTLLFLFLDDHKQDARTLYDIQC